MHGPDRDFWQQRFERNQTPWGRGAPGQQLLRWIDDGTLTAGVRICVPGCGSGHDVLALAAAGATVTKVAVTLTRERLAAAGRIRFQLQENPFGLSLSKPFDRLRANGSF